MMNEDRLCREFRDFLETANPWRLNPPPEVQNLRLHLKSCVSCQEWWVSHLDIYPDFLGLGVHDPPVKFDVRGMIRHRILRNRMIRAAGIAAIVLLSVTLRGLWKPGSMPEPSPQVMIAREQTVLSWPRVEKIPPGASVYTLEIDRTPVILIYTGTAEHP